MDEKTIKKELREIKDLLYQLVESNPPFSLDVQEKANILVDALKESQRTGDKSILKAAQKRINA